MPKRRFTDVVKEDMADLVVTEKIGTTGYGKSAVASPDGKTERRRRSAMYAAGLLKAHAGTASCFCWLSVNCTINQKIN